MDAGSIRGTHLNDSRCQIVQQYISQIKGTVKLVIKHYNKHGIVLYS